MCPKGCFVQLDRLSSKNQTSLTKHALHIHLSFKSKLIFRLPQGYYGLWGLVIPKLLLIAATICALGLILYSIPKSNKATRGWRFTKQKKFLKINSIDNYFWVKIWQMFFQIFIVSVMVFCSFCENTC